MYDFNVSDDAELLMPPFFCHCFHFHLHFTERLGHKKINQGHYRSISKLISRPLWISPDIHSEPHHPFTFLINCCFLVSPHQKVGWRSSATLCWSFVGFSLALEKKRRVKETVEVCNSIFVFPSTLCECVSEACQKSLRRVGVEERLCRDAFHADSKYWRCWFFLPTWLQFAGASTAWKAARMTGLNHNLGVAPPIQI